MSELKPKFGREMWLARISDEIEYEYHAGRCFKEGYGPNDWIREDTTRLFVFTPEQFALEISAREEAAARKAFMFVSEQWWRDELDTGHHQFNESGDYDQEFADYWQSQISAEKEGEGA